MNQDELLELMDDFIVEASEIVETLDQDLVELEHRKTDLDLLNKIFRGAHTVKGSSSFLGFDKISTLTHHAEEILNKLRKNEMFVSAEIMDILLEFVDMLRKLITNVKSGDEGIDIEPVVRKLKLANEGKIATGSADAHDEHAEEAPVQATEVADNIKKATKATEQTIRVDVERLDSLMNLMGELVLGRNRINQISGALDRKFENEYLVEQLIETASQIGLITTELQLAIMKTRMVPIGKTFNRFPRMVRDLARERGKEVDLILSGEETELDKSVVEEIGDPLIHMIRNSVDHGIEDPETREQVGKPRKGVVKLSAYHEGNHIIIEIADDGNGLDAEKIKKKAVERDVISADEAAVMDDSAAYALIFKPGFSTASVITNVSGRGVGMDVVKTNIEKLNGLINITSTLGMGTKFQLKLPLTLAIIQALFVETCGENFAIPLMSVIETVRISESDIHSFEGREVLKLRDGVLSLIRLNEVFSIGDHGREELYVVVVGIAEKQFGFVVDKLVGQEEIVIKSLGEYLGGNPGIAGATIMGDGRVHLILDVAGVIELSQSLPRRIRRKENKAAGANRSNVGSGSHKDKINVLYVDDSATDRRIMKRILESSGWINITEVALPEDVVDMLKEEHYDVLITDIMMPNIDGYDLVKMVQGRGIEIPTIAVSARNEASDRKKLQAIGVNSFLTKPVNMQAMLEKIDEILAAKL